MLFGGFVCQQGVCLLADQPACESLLRIRLRNLRNVQYVKEKNLKSATLAFFGQEIRASLPVSAARVCVFLHECMSRFKPRPNSSHFKKGET